MEMQPPHQLNAFGICVKIEINRGNIPPPFEYEITLLPYLLPYRMLSCRMAGMCVGAHDAVYIIEIVFVVVFGRRFLSFRDT